MNKHSILDFCLKHCMRQNPPCSVCHRSLLDLRRDLGLNIRDIGINIDESRCFEINSGDVVNNQSMKGSHTCVFVLKNDLDHDKIKQFNICMMHYNDALYFSNYFLPHVKQDREHEFFACAKECIDEVETQRFMKKHCLYYAEVMINQWNESDENV